VRNSCNRLRQASSETVGRSSRADEPVRNWPADSSGRRSDSSQLRESAGEAEGRWTSGPRSLDFMEGAPTPAKFSVPEVRFLDLT
jgi:hypothetical protein